MLGGGGALLALCAVYNVFVLVIAITSLAGSARVQT